MKSKPILIAALGLFALSGCSALQQIERVDRGNDIAPTTTLLNIGTPEFPTDNGTVNDPPPCDGTSTTNCPPVGPAGPPPSPCQDLYYGVCLPEGGCGGIADCGPESTAPANTTPFNLSDCSQIGMRSGVCEDTAGVGD